MTEQRAIPAFPGNIGLTHLKVYDSQAPDGLFGGSPHMHFACTEAYIVLNGKGAVQTLGTQGYAELPLEKGRVLWFTPGLIHRLINLDGELEIMVVMQNSGLPEAGDFVLTFPEAILNDSEAYFKAASLAASGHVYTSSDQAAKHRRDLAVEGFIELRKQVEREGNAALERFYDSALALVQSKIPAWEAVWQKGPLHGVEQTLAQFSALSEGTTAHLLDGAIYALNPPDEPRKLGVCGTLSVYQPEGVLT
jgi:mannose-6-phosphate isomerase-like protein (cupin superfamily)